MLVEIKEKELLIGNVMNFVNKNFIKDFDDVVKGKSVEDIQVLIDNGLTTVYVPDENNDFQGKDDYVILNLRKALSYEDVLSDLIKSPKAEDEYSSYNYNKRVFGRPSKSDIYFDTRPFTYATYYSSNYLTYKGAKFIEHAILVEFFKGLKFEHRVSKEIFTIDSVVYTIGNELIFCLKDGPLSSVKDIQRIFDDSNDTVYLSEVNHKKSIKRIELNDFFM